MAVKTQEKPHKAVDDGDVANCVHNLIEAFTNGLNIFKRLRDRRRKHKARKHNETLEPINSAELQLSNSLRRGPQDLEEKYEECYSQSGMGRRFATGDSIAHASLAEILMRLNTGLVSIITTFLHHDQGTHGQMKMNYKSLTDLSEASRRDALTSMNQLYQRLSQSQLQIHPALRTQAPQYSELSGNSSDSSKDNRKSTASRRRPSGSHVTRMPTKSGSQPQLCMVRSKSRNTARKESIPSSSSASKPGSKSASPYASPYASPLQSPVPEYAVLDPMIFSRLDYKSAPAPPPDRKRIDSLEPVHPVAWPAYAQPSDYFSVTPGHRPSPAPRLSTAPAKLPTAAPKPSSATPKSSSATPKPSSATPKPSTSNPKPSTSTSTPKPTTATPARKPVPSTSTSSSTKKPPPIPLKPSSLSNTAKPTPTAAPPTPAPLKRRLDKPTPSSYTFASDSTKLGEIPETRWARPWDYERAEMLNNLAAAAARVRAPEGRERDRDRERERERERESLKAEKTGEKEKGGKGLWFWKRAETA